MLSYRYKLAGTTAHEYVGEPRVKRRRVGDDADPEPDVAATYSANLSTNNPPNLVTKST